MQVPEENLTLKTTMRVKEEPFTGKVVQPRILLRAADLKETLQNSVAPSVGMLVNQAVSLISVGSESGIITLHRYLKSLVPSTFAARYSSFGICRKFCLSR